MVLGLLLVAVSYQVIVQENDVRMIVGRMAGSATAVLVWLVQIRAGRPRWWRTAAIGGGLAAIAASVTHVIAGGDMDVWANVTAAFAGESIGFVAIGPAAALHLISFGAGWGKRSGREAVVTNR